MNPFTTLISLLLAILTTTGAHAFADQTPGTTDQEQLMVEGDPVTGFVVDPVSHVAHYLVRDRLLFNTADQGEWKQVGDIPEFSSVIVDSDDETRLWSGVGEECYRGGGESLPLMRSTDSGRTWTDVGDPGLVPLAAFSEASLVLAHDCAGLQVSRDDGTSWMTPEGMPLGSQVTAFAVGTAPSSDDSLVIWAGVTSEGGTSSVYRLAIDNAGGTNVSKPLRTYYGFGSLEVTESGAILLGAPQGVLRSGDDGSSWLTDRDGLESTTLEDDPMEVFPTDIEPGSFGLNVLIDIGSDLYVAGTDGVYRLGNMDDAWTRIVDVTSPPRDLASIADGRMLLVLTDDGTVLQVPVM